MSAAGTGFYYTMKRQRVKEKMMLRKYDPIGKLQSPYSCYIDQPLGLLHLVSMSFLYSEEACFVCGTKAKEEVMTVHGTHPFI